LRGKAPGILFYNGHWFPDSKAKPDFQAFCINMAKFGFVVLNFETFGQGERGLSWRDHRRAEGLPLPGIPGIIVNPVNGDWNVKPISQAQKLISGKLELVSGEASDEAVRRILSGALRADDHASPRGFDTDVQAS
jgi:hypothetical protein